MTESTTTDPIELFLFDHVATTIMYWTDIPSALAHAIANNPKELLDAMVEAKVLLGYRYGYFGDDGPTYYGLPFDD